MTFVGSVISFSGNDGRTHPPQACTVSAKSLGLGDNSYDHGELLHFPSEFASALWFVRDLAADKTVSREHLTSWGLQGWPPEKPRSVLVLQLSDGVLNSLESPWLDRGHLDSSPAWVPCVGRRLSRHDTVLTAVTCWH